MLSMSSTIKILPPLLGKVTLVLSSPVLMATVKILLGDELLSTQTTFEDEAMSAMATQKLFNVAEARGVRLKTVPATLSCQDLKAFVVRYLDAPSIKESLRTAATVSIIPELAEAQRFRSVVNTSTLLAVVLIAVHV